MKCGGVSKIKNIRGFTFPEVIIFILAILALSAIMIIATNPLAIYADKRNDKRRSDVASIMDALKYNSLDNGGDFIDTVESLERNGLVYQIGNGDKCNTPCFNNSVQLQEECLDLTGLAREGYLSNIPIDPGVEVVDLSYTGYYLISHPNGLLTVGSCGTERWTQKSISGIRVTD